METKDLKIKIKNIEVKEKYTYVKSIDHQENKKVVLRGFVDTIRAQSKVVFITLREKLDTVQVVYCLPPNASDETQSMFKNLKKISVESFIEVEGKTVSVKRPIESCTKKAFEIEAEKIKIVGDVYDKLPFLVKDASSTLKDNKNPSVGYSVRIDNRFLDFRVRATHAMIRIIDETMHSFRDFLKKNDFIEIKTSKIIQSGSEGGANLFSINYFDKTAYLAQSPQLYKQLAILGGLKRVCEIGHVYRAEVSNINRYLSEFTGMDMEMQLEGTYIDYIHFLHKVLTNIFSSIKEYRRRELEIIREYQHFEDLKYKEEPVIIEHCKAVDMLNEKGCNLTYNDDFSREEEKKLGAIVKEIHGVDLFVVIDYPKDVRAFYTYVDTETGKTRSYDFIMRGEEILSGAQRETRYTYLTDAIIAKGINIESLSNYLEPFKYGAPEHIGCGIGLERFLKAFFGFDDIRYFSLFPRDPNRIFP